MIDRIRAFLQDRQGRAGTAGGQHSHEEKQLAAAALLVEAAHLDGRFDEAERAVIRRLLSERFGLAGAETESLLGAAEATQAESSQLVRFTRAIKDNFDHAERIELIEMLCEVAYADGRLHDYEANLLRRVGGLIYVSDRERGAAAKRVRARLGLDEAGRRRPGSGDVASGDQT